MPLVLLADAANVSREGKINILGNFNKIFAGQFPTTHVEMQMVLLLEADASEKGSEKQLDIKLLDEDGKNTLRTDTAKFILPTDWAAGQKWTMYVIRPLRMVEFPSPGAYQFAILVNGEKKNDVTCTLEQTVETSS